MTLFRRQYRVEGIRKPGWDYTLPGFYFVTICTHEKRCNFGRVVNEEMVLSRTGRCAQEHWQAIPLHYESIVIDEFVVMPNHLHGIIEITGPEMETMFKDPMPKARGLVGPKAASISHVVRCFKGGVTQWCKTNAPGFKWQTGSMTVLFVGQDRWRQSGSTSAITPRIGARTKIT